MDTQFVDSFKVVEGKNMLTEEQKIMEAKRLKNTFNKAYLIPTIGVFTDVQVEASKAALEDPVKYKLDCAKDYELEKKFYDNYSKVTVGDSRVKDISEGENTIQHDRVTFLENVIIDGDEFTSTIQLNCNEEVDIFMTRPRGMHMNFTGTVPGATKYELQNAFTIYNGEAFTFSVKFKDAWISIRPFMSEGKVGKSVALWFWSPETGILKDNAAKYLDVTPILKLFRG